MTVLADLLAQWRGGRLTMTELREQLQSGGEAGAKLRVALDQAIATGKIESLSDDLLQMEVPLPSKATAAVSATSSPVASEASPQEGLNQRFAKTTIQDRAASATQVGDSDKTALLTPSAVRPLEHHADAAKTSVMSEPSVTPVSVALPSESTLQVDVAKTSVMPEPKVASDNEIAPVMSPDASLTLIRSSSKTVVMEGVAPFSAADGSNATVVSARDEGALHTMVRDQQAASLTMQRPASPLINPAAGMPTLVRNVEEAKTEIIEHAKTQLVSEQNKPVVEFTSTAAEILVPGMLIKDRFALKEQVGSGGMGVVFSAVDRRKVEAQDPNPMVAIKVLDREFAQHTKAFISLQREARKAQELAHPNVVTVFDFDREGDRVFMTMEFLRGRSVETILREVRGKGLPRPEALHIIKGVAEGLAYAHRKGIVHSDLKPGNIFITEDNVPKILDFGIARAMPSRVSQEKVRDIFDAGSLGAYTAAYATEEMMKGGIPDTSDDVYALALIAYELLTGTHPYKRQSAQDAKVQKKKPAPIKGLRRIEWRLLEASLEFDRVNRPKDAGAFLKRLTGITPLQKGLIAATAVLAFATVFFGYVSYQEAGPDVPFKQLSVDTQQEFLEDMRQGDELWQFYIKDNNLMALQDSVDQYSRAYVLHPRNRDAERALRKAADTALKSTRSNPGQQRAIAKSLAERSDFLAKYDPVRELL